MRPTTININILGNDTSSLRSVLSEVTSLPSGASGSLPFEGLTEEEVRFVLVFLQCEGKIKMVESALGVSYPTVKAKLASINQRLCGAEQKLKEQPVNSEVDVLERLRLGDVSFEQAIEEIKQRRK